MMVTSGKAFTSCLLRSVHRPHQGPHPVFKSGMAKGLTVRLRPSAESLPQRLVCDYPARLCNQFSQPLPLQAATVMLDNFTLACLADHDRHGAGRHRFDGGNAKMLKLDWITLLILAIAA